MGAGGFNTFNELKLNFFNLMAQKRKKRKKIIKRIKPQNKILFPKKPLLKAEKGLEKK